MRSINFFKLLKFTRAVIKLLTPAGCRRPLRAARTTFRFDASTGHLWVRGRELVLRPKTAALFQVLAAQPGRIVSKDELLERVWPGLFVQEQAVFQCINEIRRACGAKKCIRTYAGQGYQWVGLPRSVAGRHRHTWRGAMAAVMGGTVLLAAVAAVSVEQAQSTDDIRIAVLPADSENPGPGDDGLPLGLMQTISRHSESLAGARMISAAEVLNVASHLPRLNPAAMLQALGADIIVQTTLTREGEILSAQFTITGTVADMPGQISGVYESASPAWLAQQIAYELRDAVHYSLQPGTDIIARTARQERLIAAKRLLHRSHMPADDAVFPALAAEDPAYLSARYWALWVQREQGAAVATADIARLLESARMQGDALNETRALLLATHRATVEGDALAAAAYAGAGRALAVQHDFHFMRAAFDFDSGRHFASQAAYPLAVAAFSQAAAHYRDANCAVGLLATYRRLEQTYNAAGATVQAQTVAARIKALETVFPQTFDHASRGAGRG